MQLFVQLYIMKNILLITTLFITLLTKAQGYHGFANSGMETWTNNTTIADWNLGGGSISKIEHIKNGAFGAALKNESASSGRLTASFPFTARSPRLFFDYKFTSGSATFDDKWEVDVMLTRWNTGTNTRDIIARIVKQGNFTDGTWQTFSYPFTFFSPSSPDSCFIVVRSSINAGPSTNTILNVDNFALQAMIGISNSTVNTSGTGIYPNPAKSNATLTYELKKDSRVSISVSDITGKVISTVTYERSAGIYREALDFENVRSGIYFYEIKTGDDVKTGKFTISK